MIETIICTGAMLLYALKQERYEKIGFILLCLVSLAVAVSGATFTYFMPITFFIFFIIINALKFVKNGFKKVRDNMGIRRIRSEY